MVETKARLVVRTCTQNNHYLALWLDLPDGRGEGGFGGIQIFPELIFDSLWVRLGGKRSSGRIFKEILPNRLSLTWGSVNGSYCSNVEQVGLT